jgi:hypothetical protein
LLAGWLDGWLAASFCCFLCFVLKDGGREIKGEVFTKEYSHFIFMMFDTGIATTHVNVSHHNRDARG